MPKELKPTDELTNKIFLDKLVGDERKDEGIKETASPLDFIPYESAVGLAGKVLTGAAKSQLAKDAIEGAGRFAADEAGALRLKGPIGTHGDDPAAAGLLQKAKTKLWMKDQLPSTSGDKQLLDAAYDAGDTLKQAELQAVAQKSNRSFDQADALKAAKMQKAKDAVNFLKTNKTGVGALGAGAAELASENTSDAAIDPAHSQMAKELIQSKMNIPEAKNYSESINDIHWGNGGDNSTSQPPMQQFAEGGEVQTQDPGTQVYNLETGDLGVIPNTQVTDAISSGKFSFPKGNEVTVFHPDGSLGSIPPEQAPKAFQSGFKYASPSEAKEFQLQQQYGEGALNPLKAFGAAAARTATFGGSDEALVNSGLSTPEALAERSKRNPISDIAGEVTGVVGPMAIGDELGPLNLVNGVSKVGGAVADAAAGALPEASSLAGRVLSNSLAKGAGSAIEGAAYGAGHVVSEHALGDPNLNAQSAMAEIGLSGLLGGALGSAIGAGEIAIPESVKAARETLNKISDSPLAQKIKESAGSMYDKAAAATSGKSEYDIRLARLNRGASEMTKADTEKYSSDLASSLQDHYDSMSKASKDAFKDIRPEETGALLTDIHPEGAYKEFANVNEWLGNTIKELKEEPEIYPARYTRKLEQLQDRYLGKPAKSITEVGEEALINPKEVLPDSPHDVFNALNDLKQNLDTNIGYGKIPTAQDMDAQNVIKKLRLVVKQSLENPEAFGEAAVRQAKFNNAFSEFNQSKNEFQKKFMTKVVNKAGTVKYKVDPVKVNSYLNQIDDLRGTAKSEILNNFNSTSKNYLDEIEHSYGQLPDREFNQDAINSLADKSFKTQQEFQQKASIQNAFKRLQEGNPGLGAAGYAGAALGVPAPLLGAYSAFANPYQTVQRLSKLEGLVQKTNKAIMKGSDTLFKAGSSAAEDAAGFLGSKAVTSGNPKDYEKRVDEINEKLNNPQMLLKNLHDSTDTLYNHAPDHSLALQSTAINALKFLQSKIPVQGPETPLGAKLEANKADINKFNRYYEAVENPLGVLKQIKAGMLTKEAVEALQTVHPDLYQKMKDQITTSLINNKGKAVPYKLKNQLSMFLGQDMDLSTNSRSIASNQMAQNTASNQKDQQEQSFAGIRPTAKGLSNLTISNRALTPAQTSANRK